MLPPAWTENLTREQVVRVLAIEGRIDRDDWPLIAPTGKGYAQLYLTKHHPYANSSGCQMLHRYVMMRHLGRRLEWYEHVHHVAGAPKDTRWIGHLRLCEALSHCIYHYGVRMRCGQEVEIWRPRDELGRWTPYPTGEEIERIFTRLEEEWEPWSEPARTCPVG